MQYHLIKAILTGLGVTGLHYAYRSFCKGKGVIFTLHRVTNVEPDTFSPNRILQIKPGFLDKLLRFLRRRNIDIVSMDEACARLQGNGESDNYFVTFTLDDAYKDTLYEALPVFEKYSAPFMVYVPTLYIDGKSELWWQNLEDIIRRTQAVGYIRDGESRYLPTQTYDQKKRSFKELYNWLNHLPQTVQREQIRDIGKRYGYDCRQHCSDMIMNWDELRELESHPLSMLGAHTVNHFNLARLEPHEARQEMQHSKEILFQSFNKQINHIAYPYGWKEAAGPREHALAKDLGFKSGVTTCYGVLRNTSHNNMYDLPRISLNGQFQKVLWTNVLMSGLL